MSTSENDLNWELQWHKEVIFDYAANSNKVLWNLIIPPEIEMSTSENIPNGKSKDTKAVLQNGSASE